jgi:hypothetical protein
MTGGASAKLAPMTAVPFETGDTLNFKGLPVMRSRLPAL